MHPTTDQRTDADLVASARAGDRAAFGELVRRHQRSAVRIAAVAGGSVDEADDIAQEAFVKAHAALDGFDPSRRFEPWLFTIVANTARNRARGDRRRRTVAERSANLAVAPEPDPGELAERQDRRERMVAAINRLSADDRLILTYRWFEDMSEAEIAGAIGCRRGTVKSRLNRARRRLEQELGENA